MRRSEREISDRAAIDAILAAANVCYLGINDGRTPYVVPMNYGYRDNALFLHSAGEGRKVEALRREPRVSFVVVADARVVVDPESACNGSAVYRSVMGTGTACLLEDAAETEQGLNVLMAQLGGPSGPYQPQSLANTLVIRVDIESISGKAAWPD
jgi:hypothetical protein